MMGQHDRSEALFYYFRLEDQIPETHLLRLIDHNKVFNNGEPTVNDDNSVVRLGYAYVGPRLCDPAAPSDCDYMSPFASEDCFLKHYCHVGLDFYDLLIEV